MLNRPLVPCLHLYVGMEPMLTINHPPCFPVIAGDVTQPHLGLSEEVWERLSLTLDTIMHAGALVNHAFSYEDLYLPNVLGTGTACMYGIMMIDMSRHPMSGIARASDDDRQLVWRGGGAG